MTVMTKEVMALFKDPTTAKVLATVDAKGNVNVVPIGTLTPVDENTIAFADIMGKKPLKTWKRQGKLLSHSSRCNPLRAIK